jgi:DNA (cytosine-5)-methyltransferase 1
MLLAGPPCQGFSNLNNSTRRDDDRNDLYAKVVAVAIELDVPLIIIENLPDVRADKRKALVRAQCLLQAAGYETDAQVVSGLEIGLPQTRRRMFLVASRFGQVDIVAAAEGFARNIRTLQWAIGDLEDVDRRSVYDQSPVLSAENQKRIKHLFKHDLYELPNKLRPDCHKNGHSYGAVYGRLKYDQPSPTITGGFLVPGRGRYIHPTQQRTLTPHEAARIQGFPDTFRFVDRFGKDLSRKLYTKAIGNAVPPAMARVAVAASLATVPEDYFSD